MSRTSGICVLTLATLLLATPLLAADGAATLYKGSASLSFQPEVSAAGATLVVSGPNDFRSEQSFASAGDASFQLSGDMADGLYSYELVLSPRIDSAVQQAMDRARDAGDDLAANAIAASFEIEPISGSFTVRNGAIVNDQLAESVAAVSQSSSGFEATSSAASLDNVNAASQTITTDLIVLGSECIGVDCVSSESFGFDTLRLKENNLRIHFQDTSATASFPSADWRIVANDSINGGSEYLAFEDSDNGTQPFRVDKGAGNNAIRVESGGNVGLGTADPVVELHVADGDSPTLRLEQNGSSGFTPQTWDVAGNEANFFVRDVTNGSQLPFKIRPGADDNTLVLDNDNNVGIGILNATSALHVFRNDGTAALLVQDTSVSDSTTNTLMTLEANDPVAFVLNNTTQSGTWEVRRSNSGLSFDNATVGTDVVFFDSGQLRLRRGDGSGNSTEIFNVDSNGDATATSFTGSSDRNLKENFVDVDESEILEKVAAMPMTRWNFITEGKKVQHIGPMAQDFHAAFGLGKDNRHISMVDADGVALAAIQALYQELQAKKKELETVHQRLEALEAKLAQ